MYQYEGIVEQVGTGSKSVKIQGNWFGGFDPLAVNQGDSVVFQYVQNAKNGKTYNNFVKGTFVVTANAAPQQQVSSGGSGGGGVVSQYRTPDEILKQEALNSAIVVWQSTDMVEDVLVLADRFVGWLKAEVVPQQPAIEAAPTPQPVVQSQPAPVPVANPQPTHQVQPVQNQTAPVGVQPIGQ